MRELPTGTVTLLFTDMEGSTRLLQQLGNRYTSVLAECRHVLRTAFQHWRGHEVDTQGDAFFAAFARATDAVLAAVEVQRALAARFWPEGVAVRVRIGLHTGEPSLTSEGYVGLDVHRAARIMSAAHGGQILLSQTTANFVEQELPDDVTLRDLEEHRLKDLDRPRRLFQLVISDLPADFPPLRTLDTSPNNLPVQFTPFIGREQELTAIQHLLLREEVRLVTLTGPGGTGKTRLGLQAAAELTEHLIDGVFFVNLAPISDPALVVPTIAETLGLREGAEQSLLERLREDLRQKQMVLLLDNFEQVVNAAEQVVELLVACPRLKVLMTSREVLHVRAEHEFAVPPLPLPDSKRLPDLVALSHYAAVALFVQRARAIKPDFQLTNANAHAIVEICARLDGLPLAIELAAARVKLLPPQALLARISQRLAVLTGTSRDVPARQQTLRHTIAWSYNLLDATEQRLFRRLSVFVGSCTLEAIEAVCAACRDAAGIVLDGVASLIDKSLLQQTEQEGEEPRLSLLETIREYGLECLGESREAELSQQAHARYYLALAEKAEPYLRGVEQPIWLACLEQEQGNLRAALEWLITHAQTELALRLSGALWRFWYIRGHYREGLHWLEAVLELPQVDQPTAAQAKSLLGAGWLASFLGDRIAACSRLEESARLFRELADKRSLAEALAELAWLQFFSDRGITSRTLLEESIRLAREVGDRWTLAYILHLMGEFMRRQGDYARAYSLLEESEALYRKLGETHYLSRALNDLVNVVLSRGDVTRAVALAQESLELAQKLDNKLDTAQALFWLGITKTFQGERVQAVVLLKESLALARELGPKPFIAQSLQGLGSVVLYQGDIVEAATYAEECLMLSREVGDNGNISLALSLLGEVRRFQGDLLQAKTLLLEGLSLASEGAKYRNGIVSNLVGLAKVAEAEGQPERAARLFGTVEPWFDPKVDMDSMERADYERAVEGVRVQLGEQAFAAARAEGRTMTPEQALAAQGEITLPQALPAAPSSTLPTKPAATYPDGLTAREVEVLRLLAQGLTDAQIAGQLVISPRTVNNHLTSIYSKIQVSSRSAATRYAIEHHLV